jgi:REP element-mobilizing transposase RayT
MEISERYEVHFLEIGTDKDHVHFLLQSIPTKSPMAIVKMLKSITAREIFKRHPRVRKVLWGGAFWSSGYFVNTVSKFGDETTISKYVRDQGVEKDYDVLHKVKQLSLF